MMGGRERALARERERERRGNGRGFSIEHGVAAAAAAQGGRKDAVAGREAVQGHTKEEVGEMGGGDQGTEQEI